MSISNTSFSDWQSVEMNRKYIPWIILYIMLSIEIIVGNLLILVSLSRFRDSRSSLHILIGNLAVSDLLVGALVLPFCVIVDSLDLNSNKYVCLTKSSLMVLAVGGTNYGLLLVSLDRFAAVCFPFRHHRLLRGKNIAVLVIIGWSYTALVSLLPLIGWNYYDRNLPCSCDNHKVMSPNYQRFMNCNFIFGVLVNLTLYIIVIRIAVKKARKINAELTYVFVYRRNKREFYRLKTMVIVQGIFALCWFPYIVSAIILMFKDDAFMHDIHTWTFVPGLLNSGINWVIYGYRNKQLRKQMKLYMKCKTRVPD